MVKQQWTYMTFKVYCYVFFVLLKPDIQSNRILFGKFLFTQKDVAFFDSQLKRKSLLIKQLSNVKY